MKKSKKKQQNSKLLKVVTKKANMQMSILSIQRLPLQLILYVPATIVAIVLVKLLAEVPKAFFKQHVSVLVPAFELAPLTKQAGNLEPPLPAQMSDKR
jgi:hypothetical protein